MCLLTISIAIADVVVSGQIRRRKPAKWLLSVVSRTVGGGGESSSVETSRRRLGNDRGTNTEQQLELRNVAK